MFHCLLGKGDIFIILKSTKFNSRDRISSAFGNSDLPKFNSRDRLSSAFGNSDPSNAVEEFTGS